MKIFQISAQTGEKYASFISTRDLKAHDEFSFDGSPYENWNPISLKLNLESGRKKESLVFNDAIYVFDIGLNIAINKKAKDILINSGQFKGQAEFLSVDIAGDQNQWFLVNVINPVTQALDIEKSEFRKRRDGSDGGLRKAVFDHQQVTPNSLFTFPQSPWSFMVSDEGLKNLVDENGLTGFEFHECTTSLDLMTKAS